MEADDVLIVGSCMIDLISYVPRLPARGETLEGSKFCQGYGGKGANQCVAASLLTSKTRLIARVGDDVFGSAYIKHLKELDVKIDLLNVETGFSTGMAQILVEDSGENQIVIVGGANNVWTGGINDKMKEAVSNCKVLVCQNEIKEEITIEALKIKSESKLGQSIYNAAPAKKSMNLILYKLCDIFCVNETEGEILTGLTIKSVNDAFMAVDTFKSFGCKQVIITLGPSGSVYGSQNSKTVHIPAPVVDCVDTTGAGDAFVGALAHFLAQDHSQGIEVLIAKSSVVASTSVQKPGTQSSFPRYCEIANYL